MRSVEQSYRNMQNFCIFEVGGGVLAMVSCRVTRKASLLKTNLRMLVHEQAKPRQ